MICHLKKRDGWTKTIEHDFNMSARYFVLPERIVRTQARHAYELTSREVPDEGDIYRQIQFRLVGTVETRDPITDDVKTQGWFEEV